MIHNRAQMRIWTDVRLGQKQTFALQNIMSAYPQ